LSSMVEGKVKGLSNTVSITYGEKKTLLHSFGRPPPMVHDTEAVDRKKAHRQSVIVITFYDTGSF
jgi:hypothetical protein